MRAMLVVFFIILTGLPFTIVRGSNDSESRGIEDDINFGASSHGDYSKDPIFERLGNTLGMISAPYLLKKLKKLVEEYPMGAMIVAIVIGIITNENKENIFAGIKKLRNSAYRVIGLDLKTNKEDRKNGQKKEIKFVEWKT